MSQTPSWLVRGLTGDGAVRLLAVEVSDVHDSVARAHGLGPAAARICAESLVATALMSAYIKGEERVILQVQGENPRLSFIGEVDADGHLRGRLKPASVSGDQNLRGVMMVIKSNAKKELYRGASAIESGIEGALRDHFETSNQIDVLLSMLVKQDATGRVTYAAGLLMERLPSHKELKSLSSDEFVDQYSSLAKSPLDDTLTAMALGKFAGEKWELMERRDLTYTCRCSRERVTGMLIGLGHDELKSMRIGDGGAVINCDFCTIEYRFTAADLVELEGYAAASND